MIAPRALLRRLLRDWRVLLVLGALGVVVGAVVEAIET